MKILIEWVALVIMSALLGILFWCAVFNIDLGDVTIIRQFVDTVSTGFHNVLRRE